MTNILNRPSNPQINSMEPLSPAFHLDSSLRFFGRESLYLRSLQDVSLLPFINDSQNFNAQKNSHTSAMNMMLLNSYDFAKETEKNETINKYNKLLNEQFEVGSVISQSENSNFQEFEEEPHSSDAIFQSDQSCNINNEEQVVGKYFQDAPKKYDYEDYFSIDLANALSQRGIPIKYVRGLLMVKSMKQLKTKRRLKVQRYLKKRETKTWNKKICYDCRQRVAGQRLRVKGKFIKKRTAMQILQINFPITLADLRERLIEALKHKSQIQIEEIIKKSEKLPMPYKLKVHQV